MYNLVFDKVQYLRRQWDNFRLVSQRETHSFTTHTASDSDRSVSDTLITSVHLPSQWVSMCLCHHSNYERCFRLFSKAIDSALNGNNLVESPFPRTSILHVWVLQRVKHIISDEKAHQKLPTMHWSSYKMRHSLVVWGGTTSTDLDWKTCITFPPTSTALHHIWYLKHQGQKTVQHSTRTYKDISKKESQDNPDWMDYLDGSEKRGK